MKKIIFYTILFLSLVTSLFATDEDTYVRFVTDSIIAAHKFKGDPHAMERWIDEMKQKYPDFMNQDWLAFEENLARDNELRTRVYNKILENIKSKGYKARILELGGGVATIEIEE